MKNTHSLQIREASTRRCVSLDPMYRVQDAQVQKAALARVVVFALIMASHSSLLPGLELAEGLIRCEVATEGVVQEQVEEDDQIDPLDFLRQLEVPSPLEHASSCTERDADAHDHQTHVVGLDPLLLFEPAPSSTQGTSQSGRANTPLEMPIACTGKSSSMTLRLDTRAYSHASRRHAKYHATT